MMRYVSTRGSAPELNFTEVLLAGLASDGGLYVPGQLPTLPANLPGATYAELAATIMQPFVEGSIEAAVFDQLVAEAYVGFAHPAVAPLRQLDSDLWLLELFHGPTLAFKDIALQLLARLFDHVLQREGRRVTIVAATSGDTGAAAIEAFRHSTQIDLFVLLPQGRISEVQRRQMTTVEAPNVHVAAIEGTFDDCQDLVKALFADEAFRERQSLSAVNSINWARIMAQSVYYVAAGLALGTRPDRPVGFAVPTGNFGNVYAAHVARRMGLPMGDLVIGSNQNDGLTRFFATGALTLEEVVPTLSPAMDIQVPSNFERLLFELYDRNGPELARDMAALRHERRLFLSGRRHAAAQDLFHAHRVDDAATLATIRDTYDRSGVLVDPHTAVAIAAARAVPRRDGQPIVALATAHPAKFGAAIQQAIGREPELPPALAALFDRPEYYEVLPADATRLQRFITERVWT